LMPITSSAFCGSDLHMYDGRAGADPGLVLGHEPLGVVEEVGERQLLTAADPRAGRG
jgi:glutathione-independent formaldehyde dehydrogenase